jgi:BirA family biotin operon repressor/biotin-[acetyl-CoA-carboxylase] ligase
VSTELINEVALQRALDQLGFDCCYRQQTDSTNADVLQYFQQHKRQVVAVSESQSAGRGRRGRQWLSPFAQNIYCTIGIIKSLPASDQALLSIVTGIALCRALRDHFKIEVSLKWPNDLLFQGEKLGGILIESRPVDNDSFLFVIGFGLNVFMESEHHVDIPQPSTSLQLVSEQTIDRSEVLIRCVETVIEAIRVFNPENASNLTDEFCQFDAFHNQEVEVITGDGNCKGINRGISPQGLLLLETENGLEEFSSAEISLRSVQS